MGSKKEKILRESVVIWSWMQQHSAVPLSVANYGQNAVVCSSAWPTLWSASFTSIIWFQDLALSLNYPSYLAHHVHAALNSSSPNHRPWRLILTNPYLLIDKLQQLLLGIFHIILGATDGDFVAVVALGREADDDTAALIHDGANQATLGTNDGVVQTVGNLNGHLLHIGLQRTNTTVTMVACGWWVLKMNNDITESATDPLHLDFSAYAMDWRTWFAGSDPITWAAGWAHGCTFLVQVFSKNIAFHNNKIGMKDHCSVINCTTGLRKNWNFTEHLSFSFGNKAKHCNPLRMIPNLLSMTFLSYSTAVCT